MKFRAFTETLALAAAKEHADKYHIDEFVGQTCDTDKCMGWDGESRRCDCTNNRVHWDSYQERSGEWVVEAQAY